MFNIIANTYLLDTLGWFIVMFPLVQGHTLVIFLHKKGEVVELHYKRG